MKQILLMFFLCFAVSSFAEDNIERTYYDSGEIQCEYTLKHNVRHGLAKCYFRKNTFNINNSKNNLYMEISYINGKKNGIEKMYYPNGALFQETPYSDNVIDGIKRIYSENGSIDVEISYKNGQAEGQEIAYRENGKLWYKMSYKQGKKDGIYKHYDKNGKLWGEIVYKNDVAISAKCANGRKWTNVEISNWGNGLSVNCDR